MGERQALNSLGKYHLIASLGQGGMAKVYLGLVAGPSGVNKLMVLKVLENEMLAGPEGGLELFWDEARIAARLVHPNIVHTYEVGEIDGNYFLAMEYLDGQTFRSVQARSAQNRLPRHEELRILSEVARGLHYAHELKGYQGQALGVVHRDVSPQNVFITYDGQVKLIDFGIAKTHDAGHETRVGVIKGKLNYIAPEQLRGDPLDGRADVFALGVMLWETIAGRSFSGGAKVADVTKVHARIKGEEPNIRIVVPDVPPQLADIIDGALALDREQRWQSAAAFADAIDGYLEQLSQRPSARSLSTWMQTLFSEDRATMQKLVDQQVQALSSRSGDTPRELPRLKLGDEIHTSSGVWAGRERTPAGGIESHAIDGTESAAARPLAATRRKWGFAAAGLLALVAGTFAAARAPEAATRPHIEPAVAAPIAAAASSNAAPAPVAPAAAAPLAEMQKGVILNLKVSPPEAEVRIDGVVIPAPFSGEFRASSALHRVEAVAPGYQPYARLIPLDQDRSLEIELVRVAEPTRRSGSVRPRGASDRRQAETMGPAEPAPAPSGAEPVAASATAPGADIAPSKPRLNQTQIDTADPYSTVK